MESLCRHCWSPTQTYYFLRLFWGGRTPSWRVFAYLYETLYSREIILSSAQGRCVLIRLRWVQFITFFLSIIVLEKGIWPNSGMRCGGKPVGRASGKCFLFLLQGIDVWDEDSQLLPPSQPYVEHGVVIFSNGENSLTLLPQEMSLPWNVGGLWNTSANIIWQKWH